MTKIEFISELNRHLLRLPQEEREDAIAYYEEYLTEIGPEGEAEAIAKLGHPYQVATGILAESSVKDLNTTQPARKKVSSSIKTIVLSILAAPIALPLAIAAVAVIISLIIAIIATFGSLFIASISILLSGFAVLIAAIFSFFVHFWTGLFLLGGALCLIGLGTLLTFAFGAITKLVFRGLISLAKKSGNRRKKS